MTSILSFTLVLVLSQLIYPLKVRETRATTDMKALISRLKSSKLNTLTSSPSINKSKFLSSLSAQKKIPSLIMASSSDSAPKSLSQIVATINPIMQIPVIVAQAENTQFVVGIDFQNPLNNIALPVLIRQVPIYKQPSASSTKTIRSLTPAKNFTSCHSFISEDFSCYRVYEKGSENFRLLISAAVELTFYQNPMTEFNTNNSEPTLELPIGLEYAENYPVSKPLGLEMVGLKLPLKASSEIESAFLKVYFEKFNVPKRLRIKPNTIEKVIVETLNNMEYTYYWPKVEIGSPNSNDLNEQFDFVMEIKEDSNTGNRYVEGNGIDLDFFEYRNKVGILFDRTYDGISISQKMLNSIKEQLSKSGKENDIGIVETGMGEYKLVFKRGMTLKLKLELENGKALEFDLNEAVSNAVYDKDEGLISMVSVRVYDYVNEEGGKSKDKERIGKKGMEFIGVGYLLTRKMTLEVDYELGTISLK